ncbi:hypothetical protein BIWAKO_04086 [Bosea sp. BIWAKO-01]|nr:hypothetical protein BIWAKO_04086 [Bosea sp. BIWAKO-01]
MMPFRSIVTTPEELVRIAAAFDEAWSEIAPEIAPKDAPHERQRLARITTALWSADPKVDLASLAVRRFYEIVSGPRPKGAADCTQRRS